MKHHVDLTIDVKLYGEIETIRGREKRSTFIEHLIRLGLKNYTATQNSATQNPQNNPAFFHSCRQDQ